MAPPACLASVAPAASIARRASVRPPRLTAAVLLLAAAACTPALDWREARLDGGLLTALFPCKPVERSREALLLGRRVRMTLHSCGADDATFAVTHADVGDPAGVAPALAQMQSALAANLGAEPPGRVPLRVAGMTPGEQAVRLRLRGRLPGGGDAAVEEEAAFFARGTHVYQAVVLGRRVGGEAVDTFFGSLRLPT